MADELKGLLVYADGTKIDVDLSHPAYAKLDREQLNQTLEAQIKGGEERFGRVTKIDIPGYEGNMQAGDDPSLNYKPTVKVRVPVPPFTETPIEMEREAFQRKASATFPLAGGFAELLPAGRALRGAGLIGRGLAGLGNAARSGPARAAGGAGLGEVAGALYQALHVDSEGNRVVPQNVEPVKEALLAGTGEAVGRIAFGTIPRAVRGAYRAGADTSKAAKTRELLFDTGIPDPPLHAITKNADAAVPFQGIYDWVASHPASANIIRQSNEEILDGFRGGYYQLVDRLRGAGADQLGLGRLLDIEDVGESFRVGVKNFSDEWHRRGTLLYKAAFDKMPRDTPVSWTNTKEAFENRASLQPMRRGLASDQLKAVHQDLADLYVREVPGTIRGGSTENVLDMPFGDLMQLRTDIGRRIASWEPGGSIERDDLIAIYDGITDDLKAAAKANDIEDEFRIANDYWKENMELQEQVFDRIENKIKSDAEIGQAVERLVKLGDGQGDSQRLIKIRETFGADSPEWTTMRSYFLERFATNKGQFDPNQLIKKWQGLSDRAKAALIPDTAARESYEKFITVADEYMEELNLRGNRRNPFGMVRRTEMLGPVSGLLTIGLLGGGATMATYGESLGSGGGLMVLGALSIMAPRAAAKLMTEQRFTRFATEAMSQTPAKIAGSISRLSTQMLAMEPEEQMALAEFANAMNSLMHVRRGPGGLGIEPQGGGQ